MSQTHTPTYQDIANGISELQLITEGPNAGRIQYIFCGETFRFTDPTDVVLDLGPNGVAATKQWIARHYGFVLAIFYKP